MDNRIGRKFLHPGPGFGGSCFPKDTRALTTVADQFGVETLIVDAVVEANERQRQAMIPKIEKLVGDFAGKQIGVLGLSFKPQTDDMREAPAIDIIKEMQARGRSSEGLRPCGAMEEAKHVPARHRYTPPMNTKRSRTRRSRLLLPNGINSVRSILKKSKAF
jgi:UDPglucose 6-dehydrogenase